MATSHSLEDILVNVDAATDRFVLDGAAAVASALMPTAHILLTLYVVFWGLAMMTGKINEPVMDGAVRVVKTALIVAFATSSAIYASNVVAFLYAWPSALVGITNGAEISNTTQIIDHTLSQSSDLADMAWSTVTWKNLSPIPIGWAIYIMGVLIAGIAGFVIITSKIGLAVLLALGPIFILLLLFEATRDFFGKWLSAVLTSGFTIVLISMVSQVVMNIYAACFDAASAAATANHGIVAMAMMVPASLTAIIAIPLLISVPSWASGLGGSVSAGTAGIAGFAYDKMKGATGATLRTGGKLGGKAAKAGGKALGNRWNAYKNHHGGGGNNFGQGQGQGGSIQGAPMAVYRKITSSSRRSRRAA